MHAGWGFSLSDTFGVTNGIKQVGVLLPLVFNAYVNDLGVNSNESK